MLLEKNVQSYFFVFDGARFLDLAVFRRRGFGACSRRRPAWRLARSNISSTRAARSSASFTAFEFFATALQ